MTTWDRRGSAILGPLAGAGLGAALMYLLDPRSGRRRRALARDKMTHTLHEVEDLTDKAVRDLRQRARGMVAETRARRRHDDVSDEVLHERVRAALGRYCSHPHAVEVSCHDGEVELKGPALAAEHDAIVRGIRAVRGVAGVNDLLEAHEQPDISSLQGGAPRPGPRTELMQESWTPAVRLVGGVLGAGLMLIGLVQRRATGAVVGLSGAALMTRALTNLPAKRLLGVKAARYAVELQKTITIDAPIDEVYTFFARPENLPRFMSYVEDVHKIGDGGYHWKVAGPAHTHFSWDASFDASENESVRWKSIEGSMVDNAGTVTFEPDADGRTRVQIHMTYTPPAGALGHAFARALGADPKKRMDADLLRLKSLLEEGSATGRYGKVTRLEVEGDAERRAPSLSTRTTEEERRPSP